MPDFYFNNITFSVGLLEVVDVTVITPAFQSRSNDMMTDINIWRTSLATPLVTSWMRCDDVTGTEEDKLVSWETASWSTQGVSLKYLVISFIIDTSSASVSLGSLSKYLQKGHS